MSLRTAFGSLLAVTLFCPAPSLAQQPVPPPDSVRLHQLLAQNWAYRMHEYPEEATTVGYPGQNARWTDYSLEAIARRKRELNDPLTALRAIDRTKLSANDQLNYDADAERIAGKRLRGGGLAGQQLFRRAVLWLPAIREVGARSLSSRQL